MSKAVVLLLLGMGVPASATTYTIAAGSSAATIQAIINTAGSSSGNTVAFSSGVYSLAQTLTLPCLNGTVYTGPNRGVVTQKNLPTAVLTSTSASNYALSTDSNGTSLTGAQGCTIEYLRFSGTQGGILVYNPASGITIQENAFDNNNPPPGGANSQSNIYITGQNWLFTPAAGVSHITVVWNTFFNNCAAIRAVAWPDSGGGCAATWVDAYNDYLTWSNNTVNLTEEGLKLSQATASGIASLNADVENNNMQGNSRIMIESQQDTNGVSIYSHNAFYQPFNPSYNTFELSVPEWSSSVSPTHTVDDNVFIGNVPITIGGSGAHYGIGLELWGAGSIATNNIFQGGNGPDTCAAGWGCSGWDISIGAPFTNATVTGNYFSGTGVWAGSPSNLSNALSYEDSASASIAGIVLTPNTVAETSAVLPTVAPTISTAAGSGGSVITLRDAGSSHDVSIFYTTDGSTPAIFGPGQSAGTTKVYTAPFTFAAGGTVKAIASWGQGANQGIVFPSFGYVPSGVVTTTVGAGKAPTGTGGGRTLTGAYLGAKGSANTMVKGGTLQFTAYGVYSDGSVSVLPDVQGHAVTAWNTSNHSIAKVSSNGHVSAMGTGRVNIEAMVGSVAVSPWTVTVGTKAQLASGRTAAVADMQAAPAAVAAVQENKAAVAEVSPAAAAEGQGAPVAADSSPGSPVAAPPSGPAPLVPGAVAAGPAPASPGAALGDSFLGPLWTLVTPAGGSASISNSHLFLGVPGGSNHDPLVASNQAVRVVQAIGNADFDVAIKIDSPLYAADGSTSQGLMVLADDKDFVTFGLATDGSKIGLSAHTVSGGTATSVLDDSDFSQYQNPMYLRLAKSGSAYVAYYSIDGVSWVQATSFTDTRASAWVGPFAGNYNLTPAKAVPVVMSVNWFDVQQ